MSTEKAKYSTYEEENLGFDLNISTGVNTQAYNLTKKWSIVTTITASEGWVHLPPAKLGMMFSVKNSSGNNVLKVYPFPGDSEDSVVNAYAQLSNGWAKLFFCTNQGNWKVIN